MKKIMHFGTEVLTWYSVFESPMPYH